MTELVWVEQEDSSLGAYRIAKLPPGGRRSWLAYGCEREAYLCVGTRRDEEFARGAILQTYPQTRHQANFGFVEITGPGAEDRVRTYLEKLAAALVELEGP